MRPIGIMTGKRCPTGMKRAGPKGSKTCMSNPKSTSYSHTAGAVESYRRRTAVPGQKKPRCTNGYRKGKDGMCHRKK